MSKSRRKKNEETKRRFEAIKDLMSTFAMSTVAVVAVVTLIPASPKAEVTKVVALSEEIVYQVNVTDEDNALDLSTLFVVLENQLEYYEQPISVGENSGYFDNLEFDTEYRLSVYGNKGFGQERLDTLMITTKEKIGGTILSVILDTVDFTTSYLVDVSINYPNLKYSSITLYYGYRWEHNTELVYSSIPVLSSRTSIELFDIHTTEPFHIYLEGVTTEGTELLDEIWVTPPYEFYTSLQMNYLNNKEIGFSLYNDLDIGDISYKMDIYRNDLLIRSDRIDLIPGDFHGSEFIIGKLLPSTTYTLRCVATYTNPQTLRQERAVVYEGEVTTLSEYTYSYNIETFPDYWEVSITLNDPSNYFENAYYESYDTSGEYDIFLNSESFLFNDNGNDKSVVFTILIPISSTYQITIDMRNQSDYLIKQVIEIIVNE